ncbi:peptidase M23-like protein [Pacificibacter maritimus]|uniref:Peptidase M23-like protein n=1 Tax=Pacificibacter maritimus TaxID=762213 RepID=A0A3N4UBH3_9RHOB|nr:M23 family metallopeptidase [Pacificibacter maritimus]RPE67148.1 peptidase M23-like protein [Pacificibacter maritimus]
MRSVLTSLLSILSLASPALAGDIRLSQPIDCTLGSDCYIQNYVDTDPSSAAQDFTCGALTYNGHKGVDFALPTQADMLKPVNVLASAAGRVVATRDGMADISQKSPNAPNVSGVECGNGLVLDHGGGWTTQYCHMKRGSLIVKQGDQIERGAPLGQVGLSGRTEFPHVHIVARKDGKVIDPFNPFASKTSNACTTTPTDSLWDQPIAYQSTSLLQVGIASSEPEYAAIKAGTVLVDSLPVSSPALVVYGFAFGGQTNDIMRLTLRGPKGIVAQRDVTSTKNQAQFFNATGRKSSQSWPEGTYEAQVEIERNGIVISSMSHQIDLIP